MTRATDPRTYASPEAFKRALEARLRASSGPRFVRDRQLLVFDRLLARVAAVFDDAATLKGGLVLEMRLERVRMTRDVDLRMTGSPDKLLTRLQEAGRRDLGDFMTFEIGPDADHPEIGKDAIRYDGLRFRAECRLAGKLYGAPFGIDVAFGDPIFGEPEIMVAKDVLGFAGIPPPVLRVYPIETHVAEKLHAYTLPRERTNTRVKDLPDIALLATVRALDAGDLRSALEQTFSFRGTHPLPGRIPSPPVEWRASYENTAREDGLAWPTLAAVTAAVQRFLDPLLGSGLEGRWEPKDWSWR